MSFKIENGALIRTYNSELVKIEPWGKNALRVRATPDAKLSGKDRALLKQEEITADIKIDADTATIINGKVSATSDKNG
jgi:alpha-D-xyloside xylohydrolase